ncbi:hypothetical protein [Methylobacterium dankookense]|uniref:Uncharacterized protein n=1 Tax=Methylobacterium dankookense TaxID=560405 RepID=A0A564G517_9HYPH|nr:hypothetical protein [Methylobacterium dankookense]GJD58699.1 hypothetical protein IFDJLNFL_4622 [Methylobacterium dankookense]VUF15172.1 hypothetical protein MTDSW087_04907 [Methylobacterium dankookense]
MTYPKPATVPQPVQQQQGRDRRPVSAQVTIWDNATRQEYTGTDSLPHAAFRAAASMMPDGRLSVPSIEAFNHATAHYANGQPISSASRGDVTVTVRRLPAMVPQPCQQQQAKASKPTPGHRFGGAHMRYVSSCECGWMSATHCGKGSRGAAYDEWRQHIDMVHRDLRAEATLAPGERR